MEKVIYLEKIVNKLFEMQDTGYRDFHGKLMPEIEKERIIGVRMPALRVYAKEVAASGEAEAFLQKLPHYYYEENNLHGALLTLMYKDPEILLEKIEEFLPYVDNWATCDMMSPKAFKKDLPLVCERIKIWLASGDTYTVRFGLVTLMGFFLEDGVFKPEVLDLAASVRSDEYYVKMAAAWFFSIALVKQYDAALPYFTGAEPALDPWTHNKALQKAVESRRISDETKAYLKTLKIRLLSRAKEEKE